MANAQLKSLPIGGEDFSKVIKEGCFYVDKTVFIKQAISGADIKLFTRPRRFGKTLTMTMLYHFLNMNLDNPSDISKNAKLFEGLAITKDQDFCARHMGQYPVIFLTFKDLIGNFELAISNLYYQLQNQVLVFKPYLMDSGALTDEEKRNLSVMAQLPINKDLGAATGVLINLPKYIYKHFKRPVVILIDEYDVPMQKAAVGGYYDKMLPIVQQLMSGAFKRGNAEEFFKGIITGCLRISKESVFTGVNNLAVYSVANVGSNQTTGALTSDEVFEDFIGFNDAEVDQILSYYGLSHLKPTVKEWYDGYHFGAQEIYCPWDVICYIDKVLRYGGKDTTPECFWQNTSSNDIVIKLIEIAMEKDDAVADNFKEKLAVLTSGEAIECEISEDYTYKKLNNLYDNETAIWSFLFFTGYLTTKAVERHGDVNYFQLVIPNREIKLLFTTQIRQLFTQYNRVKLSDLQKAFFTGDAKKAEEIINELLLKTISVRDHATEKIDHSSSEQANEYFYHALMLGFLAFNNLRSTAFLSNRESGEGYPDIIGFNLNLDVGCVLELKATKEVAKLEAMADQALSQCHERNYAASLAKEKELSTIYCFGLSFFRKRCKVKVESWIAS